jgi:hypothetical protein
MLQARVDEKAALLPKYTLRAATNWLLLVSDGGRPSQLFDPPTPEVASSIVSPFERTFYFGRFNSIVIELGTATAALPAALIEGEESGASTQFDFEAFIARKQKRNGA